MNPTERARFRKLLPCEKEQVRSLLCSGRKSIEAQKLKNEKNVRSLLRKLAVKKYRGHRSWLEGFVKLKPREFIEVLDEKTARSGYAALRKQGFRVCRRNVSGKFRLIRMR